METLTDQDVMLYPELHQRIGMSRGWIAALEASGRFPKRRRIGVRGICWLRHEVEAWLASAPEGYHRQFRPHPSSRYDHRKRERTPYPAGFELPAAE